MKGNKLVSKSGGASEQVLLCDKIVPPSILAPVEYSWSIRGSYPKHHLPVWKSGFLSHLDQQ